ncbi:MAG: ribonuclease [Geobacteraceae bacterium]|nr:MAG: ribonuclease [Geobacteraceae bacterium]
MKIKKEAVLKLLRENAGAPRQFRELMHHFGIDKARRPQFKEFMDRLVDGGELVKLKGNLYAIPADAGLITGRLMAHRDGYGFVAPDEGGEDIFIPARYLTENMHGDRVEVRIASSRRDGKREGRIVRTLERAHTRVVGRFEEVKGAGFVIPDEVRITQDILIPSKAKGAARSGEVVVTEITSYPTGRRKAEGRIVEVLGWPEEPEVEVQTIIRKYDLPFLFSAETLASARSVSQSIGDADLKGRVDLRGSLTVTIDGETARDFDDAVAVKREDKGWIRLWVSIADVSHYVKPGSPLDGDAYARGTSVYFPDRCVPMLPEELSNGICSLNPAVDRLTVTAEMLFDKAGSLVHASFYPSVIRSSARLTYTIVKRILVDKDKEATNAHRELIADLLVMEELALRLMEKRRKRGSIDFDLPEPEIVLDLQGGTLAIIRSERNLAHRIIEEFMLAANEAVASYLEERNIPSLYRVHEPPDPVKLNDFREFIYNFGYELRMKEESVDPVEFQRLLGEAAGKPEERMINEVLLRCMKQARYAAENLGHFGLAAPCYTHFTSPIRRYPDLVVHRILKGVITGKLKEREMEKLVATLPETAAHTSRRERVAMEAEREIVDLKKMQFMRDKVGEEFDGFITGVASYGFFVELVELFVEGMVHVSALPNDFYRYLEKQHALLGDRSRELFRIGDRVRVRVASVSLEKKQIDFVLAAPHESSATISPGMEQEEYPRIPVRGKRPPAFKGSKKEDGPEKRGGKGGRRHGPRKKG